MNDYRAHHVTYRPEYGTLFCVELGSLLPFAVHQL